MSCLRVEADKVDQFRACPPKPPGQKNYSLHHCCELHHQLGMQYQTLFKIMLQNQQAPFMHADLDYGGLGPVVKEGLGLRDKDRKDKHDVRVTYQVLKQY